MSLIIWNSSAVSTLNVFSEVGRLAISFISSVAIIRIHVHKNTTAIILFSKYGVMTINNARIIEHFSL